MLSLPGHLAILVEVRLGLDNLLDLPGIVAPLGLLDRLGCRDCPRVVLQGPPDRLGRRDCLKVVLAVLGCPPDRRHCPSLGGEVGRHRAVGRVGCPAPRILTALPCRLESLSLLAESGVDWKRCKIPCLILV